LDRKGNAVVKLKLEPTLVERAKRAAAVAGYASVEEFVADSVEKEIRKLKIDEDEDQVAERLRGLGYIE
jgi:hypothetical protein